MCRCCIEIFSTEPKCNLGKGKSLDALLLAHLKTNGWVHDAYTDDIDRQSRECATALKHTYWTQEAEEMRNQIEQNAEMIKTNKNKNHRK